MTPTERDEPEKEKESRMYRTNKDSIVSQIVFKETTKLLLIIIMRMAFVCIIVWEGLHLKNA